MQAIDLFPYWDDNRALLAELVQPLREEDLEFRPAPGLSSLGGAAAGMRYPEDMMKSLNR